MLKTMKARMEELILSNYPEAIFEHYLETGCGSEYLFFANAEMAEDYIPFACVNQNGKLVIFTDF